MISAQPSLPNEIEDELRAKNLSHFLLRSESKVDTIVIEVYENQAWHPVLQTWGAVVGVHLNAVLDRSPYTDESGTKVLTYGFVIPKSVTLLILMYTSFLFVVEVWLKLSP